MKHLASLFSGILILFSSTSLAIDFSRVNIAWQYDVNSALSMSHRVVDEDGAISIFLRIETDTLSRWKYQFLVQDGYEEEKHRQIDPLSIDTLAFRADFAIFKIQLPAVEENLLVIKTFKVENYYYYDIGLRIGTLSYPSIYPADSKGLPIFENYISRSGYRWMGSSSFHAIQYLESFSFADPPMADMKPLAPNAKKDTSFVFSDSVSFVDDFFYVIREDSSASTGVVVLKEPPYFPEYRQLQELVESMLYITNESERKSLTNSRNIKQSFDSFWMNNFNTKARARSAIRKYYNSVEAANLKFTDFKPGWKSDRGMILIVFGMPDEVYRKGSLEEWYYDSGDTFEFTIISSFFAPRTYTLRRSKELEETWYQQIAAIRRGFNE